MEEKKLLISVIVPVYNGEHYLEKCIESIENQTYEDIQVIIVNDGSTDGTGKVCVKLREKYANIRVINMEDEGVSAARNAGLDAAEGTFVTFVDADDRLRPRTLEILYDGIVKTGCDICGCGFLTFTKETEWLGLLLEKYRIEEPKTYKPETYMEEQLLQGNSRCWSKLYRRNAIGKLRFRKGLTIGEDMLFLMQLMPYIRGIAETAYPGYGYYQNPAGAMLRAFTPRYMDQITCWELAREETLKVDQKLLPKVTSILLISIMLTAGKIALLSKGQRRKQKQYIRICHEKLKTELQVPGAFELLPKGYQMKVKLFQAAPGLYLSIYRFRKYAGRKVSEC